LSKKKKLCYVCQKHNVFAEGHHIIPRAMRGGDKGPKVNLCTDCHTKVHHLALSKTSLESITNKRLRILVKIIRLSYQRLPHGDYKVQLKIPGILYSEIRRLARDKKSSIKRIMLSILANYFVEKRRRE